MISAAIAFTSLLVLFTYFPGAEPLDVYENPMLTPKEKPVARQSHSFWYTPRLGKRNRVPVTPEEKMTQMLDEVFNFGKPTAKRETSEEEFFRKGRGDMSDIIYKFPPFAPRPGRAFFFENPGSQQSREDYN